MHTQHKPHFRTALSAVTIALFVVAASSAHAQVTLTNGSFSWDQANVPNTASLIPNGTWGGATFNNQPNDSTSNIAFPASATGGSFDSSVGVIWSMLNNTTGTRALNLPYNGDIGQTLNRAGVTVGWNPGTLSGSGQTLNLPALPNLAGNDFVVFESGSAGAPEGMMVRAHVSNGSTSSWTNWYYQAPVEETPGSPILHAYAYDLSNLGVAAGAKVDQIQIANMVASDRINNPGTYAGTGTPGITWSNSGKIGGALQLDGSGDYGSFNSNLFDISSQGTMSVWVNIDSAKRNELLHSATGSYGVSPGLQMQVDSSGRPFVYTNLQEKEDSFARATGASINTWHHLAFRWNITSQTVDVLVDGAVTHKYNAASWDAASLTINQLLYVGRDPSDDARYFDGLLDDLAFFDTNLSDSAIADIIANGVNNSNSDLIAHWTFDEGAGTTATDSINNIVMSLFDAGPYVAEGAVLPEIGGDYSPTNPGPYPGNYASFNIPYGNSTFDPDPMYVAVLHNLQEVPEPAGIALLAIGGIALLRRRRHA